ncbi:MAG: uroporphyrinogen decarboxylase family protein [Oscillospiraceae bacterium]|nr:uroporphyrinogen decarboxylase family protein [Oscillospiraceae bacterium]
MNSYERVYARLAGKPVDKIPNLNIAMSLVAKQAGATYRQYAQDYRELVKGNLICAEKFGFDAVSVISDPVREASAFGATVHFPEFAVPYTKPYLLEDAADLTRLKITDPLNSPRTLDRIKAVGLMRERVGYDYPVIGWVEGVLAEAADLRGVNNLMTDLIDDEPWLYELMEIIFDYQKRFALEQIKAGADIIGVGNAVASLVGPALYEEYALRYDKELVEYIHQNHAKVKLHICGNISSLLPLLARVAPDILDIDWMVDFEAAVKSFSDLPVSVSGNMDPVAVLLQGTADTVEKETRKCIAAADKTSFIAAGCEVPAETPEENLLSMDKLLYL